MIRRRFVCPVLPLASALFLFNACVGDCGGPVGEDGGDDGNDQVGGGGNVGEGEGSNDGPPAEDQSVGSCDGVTPAPDENHDCDGWCLEVEGGWIPCDDGTPTAIGEGEGEGEGVSADGVGEGEGAVAGEGEGAVIGEGEGEGEGPQPPVCGPVGVTVGQSTIAPRVLLVVDKSGSMDDGATGFSGSKWDAAVGAIKDVVDNTADQIDFGLMMFPSDPSNDACSAGSLDVTVHSNAALSISLSLNFAGPGGATPTATTLVQAKSVLDGLSSQGGPRAVLLATDGGPNCNGSLNGNTCRCTTGPQADCQAVAENCLDDVNTIGAAGALNAAGYRTFVVGVPGSENFSDVLNATATAGGTAQAGATAYYDATSSAGLATALEDIVVRLTSCTLSLSTQATADQLTVTINGASIARDQQNGWDLVDPSTMQLFGAACDTVQNGGGSASIDVEQCVP